MTVKKQFIEESELFIFDLDGTLYEDTKHFDLFAEKLKKKVPNEKQNSFYQDMQRVKKGTHPLAIGKVYDAKEDLLWTWDPFTEKLSAPENWNGDAMEQHENDNRVFPAGSFDFKRWISIGDGWWPPYVLALHYGVAIEDCHEAYDETKVDMAEGDGWLTKTPGLREFLDNMKKEKTLVLITNSDANDVERLLEHLHLAHLFEQKITSAHKPVHTKQHFQKIIEQFGVPPERIGSIGDNFMNEIAPALQFGMKAVWLSPDEPNVDYDGLWVVRSLTEII